MTVVFTILEVVDTTTVDVMFELAIFIEFMS